MHLCCEEVEEIIDAIRKELMEAAYVYGPMASAHEGLAIINEEFDELKEWVWMKPALRNKADMKKEAVQLAAMSIRFIFDILGRDKEGKIVR